MTALAALLALSAALAPEVRANANVSAFADTSRPVSFIREVVVTGTRFPRAYFESPQALSFVNRAQINEQAAIVIGDVLGALPGLDMSKDSPWEQRPVLRGLSGQRVLVLMDGTPMNSARGNGPHPSLVDPSQIERVEVVRGPSSVAYGSDALGGVINIITRQAPPASMNPKSLAGSVHVGGSSAEGQSNMGFTLVPHIGRLSAFLAGGGRHSGDYTSPNGTVLASSFRDYNALANLRYDFTDRMTLKGGYQQYRARDIGIPGLSSPTANYGPGNTTAFSFRHYNRDEAHLALDHNYENSWLASSHVKVYWQKEQRDFYSSEQIGSGSYGLYGINFDPASAGSSYRNTNQDRYFDLDTYGAQIQMTSRKTDRYLFTAGLDGALDATAGTNVRARSYHFRTAAGADSAGRSTYRISQSVPTGRFANYAGFFQNEWFVSRQWAASVGARYTRYRYRTDLFVASPGATPTLPKAVDNGAACGSFGLVYTPTATLHLTANVANGYREPNAQDLFFNGPASVGTVFGNPDLKPEKSMSYDAGVRWEPQGLAVAANVFYSTYRDLINALPSGPGAYTYDNVATATIYGADLEAEYRVHPQVTLRTTMSDQIGDITNRDVILKTYQIVADKVPLEQVPPFKGTTSVRWTDKEHVVWIEATGRYSWRTNRLPPPIPNVGMLSTFKKEYLVGDIMMGTTVNALKLQFGVKNFTNRSYRPSQASVEDPGISAVAGMSVAF
jgi:hemoglobin/transferrin/lactoferrin receptor protein